AAGWIAGDAEGDNAAFVAIPTSATCLARDNHAVASVTEDAPDTFPVGETMVTWTITDQSGNALEVTQSVTVLDGGAPVVVTQDAQAALDAAGFAYVTAADVDGGSTDACSALSLSLDVTSFSCSD